MPLSRILLILAAVVALISVGVATLRPDSAPVPGAQTQAAPNSGAMIADLEKRLKANPNDVEGWAMLGLGFYQSGRFAESATAYKRAAQLAPDVAEHWANYGEALMMASTGSFPPDAKQAFTTALARDPKDVRARYFLAVEKDMAGNHRGAIDDWIALVKDAPPGAPWEADVRNLIAQVAAQRKIDVANRLPAPRGPSAAQVRDVAALPKAEQNAMIASMVDGLAKKLQADPKNPEGWVMLMRSYAALGRTADAQAALKTAVAANPASVAQLTSTAAEIGISK